MTTEEIVAVVVASVAVLVSVASIISVRTAAKLLEALAERNDR